MEEIRDYFIVSALEDDVRHVFVVFRVNEFGHCRIILRIQVTEPDFQRAKEKLFSVFKAGVVLAYHGTQFVCYRCQATGTLFPLDQVAQHMWKEIVSRVRGADG